MKRGVFDDLDAAITWHPFDRNRVSYDIWQAQDMKNYKFYGVKSTCVQTSGAWQKCTGCGRTDECGSELFTGTCGG